ncbi:family 20 glycosylhydrolase, partial [Candidatus Bathyarchaeota archaeon]|nr:family 20 glycosylhydrolase [Candidatus Bathyarchaeota archaeon]
MTVFLTITGLKPLGERVQQTSSFDPKLLLPMPQQCSFMNENEYVLKGKITVQTNLDNDDDRIINILEQESMLRNWGREVHFTVEFLKNGGIPNAKIPEWDASRVPDTHAALFAQQGYTLTSKGETITIVANHERGLFYGITTLLQVAGNHGIIPEISILDYPSMEIRGVSDENARGQAGSVEGLKRYVRYLGLMKINTLQMNLEDMFRSKSHPKSSDEYRGSYSKEEINEICDHAKKYHVDISPIQTTGGHYDNVFLLPEYKHLAEFEHVAMCFDISNPEIYSYLEDIIQEEVNAWNTTTSFHMACDESWDVGKGRSRKLVERIGIGNAYLEHYTKCYHIIKTALERKHGTGNFRIYIYHDILINHTEVLEGLPRENLVIDYWRYSPKEKYPDLEKIIAHGFDFVVSPSVMDYQRIHPSLSNSEKNIINLITFAYKKSKEMNAWRQFKGQVNTSWGDYRNENPRDLRLYGYALCATVSWNVNPWLDFTNRAHNNFASLKHFKESFYRHVVGTVDHEKGVRLEYITHAIEDGKLFRSRFGFNLLFPKLWTHPLQHLRKERARHYPEAIEMFEKGMALCDEISSSSRDLHGYTKAVRLSLQLHRLYCKKVLIGRKIKKCKPDKLDLGKEDRKRNEVISGIKEIIGDFKKAKNAYQDAWLLNCKPNCNDFLLGQYDWMVDFYAKILECYHERIAFREPSIPSEYIYTPATKKCIPGMTVRFRHTFVMGEAPARAWLQAFIINHGTITINGTRVGDVEYRNTLSFMILEHCVKYWDITRFLKEGTNIIEI